MSLHQKIFVRILLLIFLLIVAIVFVGVSLEKQDWHHYPQDSIQDRIVRLVSGPGVVITANWGMGFLVLLLSIPAAWIIARLATHEAQVALQKTEVRYRSLFDGISNGVAIYSAVDNGNDFIFLDYNPAGQAMDNAKREEVLGKKVTEVFPQVGEFGLLDVLRRVWRSGVSEELPVAVYKDNQVVFWRHNTVYKLPSGELVAVYSDETKRMEAEAVMRSEHARFVAVLESLDAVVYAADMNTHELLFANKQVRDQFGDIIGKTCWKTIQAGQTGPCEFCTNDRLLDSDGKPKQPYIWEVNNTADGRWYQCHDQAIQWPDGRMVRLEIATDITERKEAEDKIKLRGHYLQGLSDAAHSLLGATDSVPFQEFVDIIGRCSGACRAYIFLNHVDSAGQVKASQKAEWCVEGIEPEIENPILQNMSYDEWMPRWKETLAVDKSISGCVRDFPLKVRELLDPQGIKTILAIPLFVDDEWIGFVGLDNCISEREWEEAEKTFLGIAAHDLTLAIRRVNTDRKVRSALNEKDVLLREIHHRVKNNMQVITSLLNLQARKISDKQALAAIRESQDRIHVMSLVHESLYRSRDLSSIAMDHYFTKLATDIARLHNGMDNRISWSVDAGSVTLSINEAIPIGLIANELLSNAFKHAFPDGRPGSIEIILHETSNGNMELVIADDGQGMPDGIDVHGADTLGLQLVSRLAKGQLGGDVVIEGANGTTVKVTCVREFQDPK